jgi:5-methylcytosine-specific restriction endonuclease McrA
MARLRDYKAEWQRRKLIVYRQACLLRDALRQRLGGKCQKCGRKEELEFHHPNGRNWEPRRCNLRQRMRRYWADYRRGNLALWCSPCNSQDGGIRGYWQRRKKRRRKGGKR